jgi:hypothetical protein
MSSHIDVALTTTRSPTAAPARMKNLTGKHAGADEKIQRQIPA